MKQPYKNMAIEYFYELEITQEEFDSLDEATIASIGLISHAVNEINAMMRVFVYNAHSRVENEAADTSGHFYLPLASTARVRSCTIFGALMANGFCFSWLRFLQSGGLGFPEQEAAHVVGDVCHADFGFGSCDPDSPDEEAHVVFLIGEDMLDARAWS